MDDSLPPVVRVMRANMKKLDPPYDQISLSRDIILTVKLHDQLRPTHFAMTHSVILSNCRVQAMANPVSCHAIVMSSEMVRLYGSMIWCIAIVIFLRSKCGNSTHSMVAFYVLADAGVEISRPRWLVGLGSRRWATHTAPWCDF